MDEYRNVSTHVQPLASGRLVAPGGTCELDLDDPHDRALAETAFAPVETETDYQALPADQLAALADAAGLEVDGTGSGGRVLKDDLVKALTAHHTKKED